MFVAVDDKDATSKFFVSLSGSLKSLSVISYMIVVTFTP
jgi:hypothetical protein